MTKYLLVDTLNMFMRAKHVTRGDAFEKAGLALTIAINSINWAWKKFGADHVVFCLEGRSWRKDHFREYKANRAVARMGLSQNDMDEDAIFFDTLNSFMLFVKDHTNCTVLKSDFCEADDFIARWIQVHEKIDPKNEFIIISSDSDFAQLMAENVQIYDGVNKKLYRSDGIFDDKLKPYLDKKGNKMEPINPEFLLFEKCIRGDKSDNVASAYPGVRDKSTKHRIGLLEAFADRHEQGYSWVTFMKSKWEEPNGTKHIVEDDYKRNQILIDLTRQPDEIKELLDGVIQMETAEPKNVKQIGMHFLQFCGKHELKRIAEQADNLLPIFTGGFVK